MWLTNKLDYKFKLDLNSLIRKGKLNKFEVSKKFINLIYHFFNI